jgi:hypothetical protein
MRDIMKHADGRYAMQITTEKYEAVLAKAAAAAIKIMQDELGENCFYVPSLALLHSGRVNTYSAALKFKPHLVAEATQAVADALEDASYHFKKDIAADEADADASYYGTPSNSAELSARDLV